MSRLWKPNPTGAYWSGWNAHWNCAQIACKVRANMKPSLHSGSPNPNVAVFVKMAWTGSSWIRSPDSDFATWFLMIMLLILLNLGTAWVEWVLLTFANLWLFGKHLWWWSITGHIEDLGNEFQKSKCKRQNFLPLKKRKAEGCIDPGIAIRGDRSWSYIHSVVVVMNHFIDNYIVLFERLWTSYINCRPEIRAAFLQIRVLPLVCSSWSRELVDW